MTGLVDPATLALVVRSMKDRVVQITMVPEDRSTTVRADRRMMVREGRVTQAPADRRMMVREGRVTQAPAATVRTVQRFASKDTSNLAVLVLIVVGTLVQFFFDALVVAMI